MMAVIGGIRKKIVKDNGFSLVELLVTSAIMVFVIAAVYLMLGSGYNTYSKVDDQITAQSEARRNLSRMSKYIRGVSQITEAAPYELTLNVDIDDDGIPESVHFYLSHSNTRLNMTIDGGTATVLGRYVTNVSSGNPIFTYYAIDGSEITNMEQARTATKTMKINLVIDADPSESPVAYTLESQVVLRNFE